MGVVGGRRKVTASRSGTEKTEEMREERWARVAGEGAARAEASVDSKRGRGGGDATERTGRRKGWMG